MQKYSDFFKTLHDEQNPTGYLGRGTHYSVLRAVVWHDKFGQPLQNAHYLDYAIIWDEDHDIRVVEVLENMYFKGLLSSVTFVGERKGCFSAILDDAVIRKFSDSQLHSYQDLLQDMTRSIDDDYWSASVTSVEDSGIINAEMQKVSQYLSTLKMLWDLGVKPVKI